MDGGMERRKYVWMTITMARSRSSCIGAVLFCHPISLLPCWRTCNSLPYDIHLFLSSPCTSACPSPRPPNCLAALTPAHVPAHLPACMPACLHACLPPCLPAFMSACLHAYLPSCLPACLHVCLPAFMSACRHGIAVPWPAPLSPAMLLQWRTSSRR